VIGNASGHHDLTMMVGCNVGPGETASQKAGKAIEWLAHQSSKVLATKGQLQRTFLRRDGIPTVQP
jgi:hypothetical protein